MAMTLIGIDCATQASKVGIARAETTDGHTEVIEARVGGAALVETLLEWITLSDSVLLALDAPLGWPEKMGKELQNHCAGSPLSVPKNEMFRRETDRVVHEEIGKLPLEVGANLIARTAHAALELLGTLRDESGMDLPLAWDRAITESSVIEVYPAATLKARGIDVQAAPPAGPFAKGPQILNEVKKIIGLPALKPIVASPDAVDAVVCVLAAHDFLYHEVLEPRDSTIVEKEGWIWVKKPG